MKANMGIFLAGALVAFLLDPKSGRERRRRVSGWAGLARRRLERTKEQAAASDTLIHLRESAAPALAQTLHDATTAAQGRAQHLSAAVASRAAHTVSLVHGATKTAGDESAGASATTAAPHAAVAPRPEFDDPIPEGATNDPTLVARVESELFRDGTLPKGKLNIDAANGVVTLRGSVDDAALAGDIVERTGAIEGVARVVDLLERR